MAGVREIHVEYSRKYQLSATGEMEQYFLSFANVLGVNMNISMSIWAMQCDVGHLQPEIEPVSGQNIR